MIRRQLIGYAGLLAACWGLALAAGWTTFGSQIDSDAYDFLFRIHPPKPWTPTATVLGIDERTLTARGGLRHIRRILAEGLEKLAEAPPSVVVVDLVLADAADPEEDARLERALASLRNVVLASDLTPHGWEDPLPRFAATAAAIGHVHADPDPYDNVVRQIPLEKASGRKRLWAMALEGFRLALGAGHIEESPQALRAGGREIPCPRRGLDGRPMLVRYQPRQDGAPSVPTVDFHDLLNDPAAAGRLRGKVVFIGITAQTAAPDRHMTPYSFGQTWPGVEIHASAYETLSRGNFLRPVSDAGVALFTLLLASSAGLAFAWRSGWQAYALGGVVIALAHLVPYAAFRSAVVFPYAAPMAAAWLATIAAATYQHFVVRRMWRASERDKQRYQQAIHFVTHEMRSPLTAIQGSSEMMGRYQLTEEKRKQVAGMINTESKRLARMVQTFLDVERLSAGQMELRRDPFELGEIVQSCVERARPLAERKRIRMVVEPFTGAGVTGDRELMEYAVYNLLSNAIKYSPAETEVVVSCARADKSWKLSVRDQGVGMDEKELRNIFRKFYRTRKAESSGEAGTGIGLSIVEQIVSHHGGVIEVSSRPGAGSCFTIVLPALAVRAGSA